MSSKAKNFWKARPQFRVLTAGITIDPPGATYGPRLARHYEFIWLMEGDASIHFDQRTIRAETGMVLFRGPGVRDYYEWSGRRRTVHAYIHFDLDLKRRKGLSRVPPYQKLPPNDILRPLFGYLLDLEQRKEPFRSRLMLPALDLMLAGYAAGEWTVKAPPSAHLPEPVERALEAIRQGTAPSPPKAMNLSDLARSSGTTPENLCRLFKKSLELGPLEYAKLSRLDRAANLLRRTPQGLKQIATATGFYDSFHLSRTFKQVYGLSPKEFRESPYNEWISQKNPIIRTLYVNSRVDFLKPPPGGGRKS